MANRFGQMAKSALPGVASGTPPRPPKMAAPAAKASASKLPKAAAAPALPARRRGNVNNLGKYAHPPKARR